MFRLLTAASAALFLAACAPAAARTPLPEASGATLADTGTVITVADTTLPVVIHAAGVAAPVREATLSTRLMAAVTAVLVTEGDVVRAGQPLVRLDARDLEAKREQVQASRAAAEAMVAQAAAHTARLRALFADDAAPKAMLEQAEVQLVQAESQRQAARAAAAELDAVSAYAEIRAPFAGVVTRRFVDPGDFAAPGAPVAVVQDASALRVTVHAAPDAVRALRAGDRVPATIEGVAATATIEGVVPAMGSLHAVNALVENRDGRLAAGSAATLALPAGTQRGIAVPVEALVREGDLVGVVVRTEGGDIRRWVRTGAMADGLVEVTSGLRAGDRVVLPTRRGEH